MRYLPARWRGNKKLEVRGAPAIGAAAGFAMVLGWQQLMAENRCNLPAYEEIKNKLIAARPTAVNLAWAANKLYAEAERLTEQSKTQSEIACALEKLAQQIYDDDIECNKKWVNTVLNFCLRIPVF